MGRWARWRYVSLTLLFLGNNIVFFLIIGYRKILYMRALWKVSSHVI